MSPPTRIAMTGEYPQPLAFRYEGVDYQFPRPPTSSSVPSLNTIFSTELYRPSITADVTNLGNEGDPGFHGLEELGPEVVNTEPIGRNREIARNDYSPVSTTLDTGGLDIDAVAPFRIITPHLDCHGASNQAFSLLKLVWFSHLRDPDELCAICLDKFSYHSLSPHYSGYTNDRGPTNMLQLPCGHRFGAVCIETWLEEQHTCPSCRDDLESAAMEDRRSKISSNGSSILRISASAFENSLTLSRIRVPVLDQQNSPQTQETVLEYTSLGRFDRLAYNSGYSTGSSSDSPGSPETPPSSVTSSHLIELPWGPVLEYTMTGQLTMRSNSFSGWGRIDDDTLPTFGNPSNTNTPHQPIGTNYHPSRTSLPDTSFWIADNRGDSSLGKDEEHTFPSFAAWQKDRARPRESARLRVVNQCLEEIDAAPCLRTPPCSDPWAIVPADHNIVDETAGWNDSDADGADCHLYWPKSDFVAVVYNETTDEGDEFSAVQDDTDDYCTDDYESNYDLEDEQKPLVQHEIRNGTKLLRILGCPDLPIDIRRSY